MKPHHSHFSFMSTGSVERNRVLKHTSLGHNVEGSSRESIVSDLLVKWDELIGLRSIFFFF